jgi:FAD/FMN-containing dehydrogenase
LRVPTQATAFGLRREHFLVGMLSAWEPNDGDDGSAHRQWSHELSERLAPYALPGGHPNLLGPDEAGRLADAFGPNAPRLRELKRRYDPHGVFSAAIGTRRA